MNPILQIEGISKRYRRLNALNNLTLDVNEGQVFGLLGPNGSGKTTTLGIVLDVIHPTNGSYKWFGEKPTADKRKKIGSILETPSFYPYLNARQNLEIVAKIKECGTERIDSVLEWVGLLNRSKDPFKHYSLGMKQRLSIATALLADPPVLILDEPTNGLDPTGIAEIRNLIIEIAQRGKTIILASHLLDEVQKVCTHFAILSKGKKIHSGIVSEVLRKTNKIEVAAPDLAQLKIALEKWPQTTEINDGQDHVLTVVTNEEIEPSTLNKYLTDQGIYINHMQKLTTNLEEEFLKILSEQND